MKIDPYAGQSWQQSSTTREGYLVTGSYRESECLNGEVATGDYGPGGYFQRVAGAVYGGPEAASVDGAIWFLRTLEKRISADHGGMHARPNRVSIILGTNVTG